MWLDDELKDVYELVCEHGQVWILADEIQGVIDELQEALLDKELNTD